MIAATGPKSSSSIRGHARFHVRQDRRRIIGARSGRNFAAEQQLRARSHRRAHLPVHVVAEIVPGLRAHVGAVRERIAHLLRLHERDESLGERLEHRARRR